MRKKIVGVVVLIALASGVLFFLPFKAEKLMSSYVDVSRIETIDIREDLQATTYNNYLIEEPEKIADIYYYLCETRLRRCLFTPSYTIRPYQSYRILMVGGDASMLVFIHTDARHLYFSTGHGVYRILDSAEDFKNFHHMLNPDKSDLDNLL